MVSSVILRLCAFGGLLEKTRPHLEAGMISMLAYVQDANVTVAANSDEPDSTGALNEGRWQLIHRVWWHLDAGGCYVCRVGAEVQRARSEVLEDWTLRAGYSGANWALFWCDNHDILLIKVGAGD